MNSSKFVNPFHAGELEAQARAGAGDMATRVGGFIRDYLPQQHREFHTAQPFLILSGGDATGSTWITLVEGPQGYATSPDQRHIHLDTQVSSDDPLSAAFNSGTTIGVLGIELATRRRNRFNGRVQPDGDGLRIEVHQSFGNCPQYIHERAWKRVDSSPAAALHSTTLADSQIALIGAADTLFIGSGHDGGTGMAFEGYDASHRGGPAGFVQVINPAQLRIPDYPGNNFFNTIGNLTADPRIGLLFVDFETGGLLHVSGSASIDWHPDNASDLGALRMINVDIDAVIERPRAISLRWEKQRNSVRRLQVASKVRESEDITSFYLVPVDGRPLDRFKAGQHLPIEVQIPGQAGTSTRSYSLSGPQQDRRYYRISVKREARGLVSRFLHDDVQEGSVIDARKPSGDFVIPDGNTPLVLVSAGVGLTPMVSMLHAASLTHRPVWYVHGTRNGRSHALDGEVCRLLTDYPNARQLVCFSRPGDEDSCGKTHDQIGRLSAEHLLKLDAGPQAQYLLCGPVAFISQITEGLEAKGVPPEQIHVESFGPTNADSVPPQ